MICPDCRRLVVKYCNNGHPTRRGRVPTQEELRARHEQERRLAWLKTRVADAQLVVENPDHRAYLHRRGTLTRALHDAVTLEVITEERAHDLLALETVRALGRDLDLLAQLGRGHCLRCDDMDLWACRRAADYAPSACQCRCHRPGLRPVRRDVSIAGESWLLEWSRALTHRVVGVT